MADQRKGAYCGFIDLRTSHRRITLSLPVEASVCPSGAKATALTAPLCPSMARSSCPFSVDQTRMEPYAVPAANDLLSPENASDTTGSPLAASCRLCLPVLASHRRMVWSALPEANDWPSGANATALTGPWCKSLNSSLPVPTSHTRNEWSSRPATSFLPSGEKAMAWTRRAALKAPVRASSWPNLRVSLPVANSQRRTV